mmetsp:Transcript_3449/g.7600  ORF Transcript_3449/g.7600 Transcript_3449/m.7600 type:complete len:531 (+) Transcript_3449:1-1593(+)
MALYESVASAKEYSSMPPKPKSGDAQNIHLHGANQLLDDDQIMKPNMSPIHFCFIVHGHNGRPTDLSYLHHTIKAKATESGIFRAKSSGSCVVGRKSENSVTQNERKVRRRKRDRFFSRKKNNESDLHHDKHVGSDNDQLKGTLVVHNSVCNEGKTHDGIIKGGERLTNEMLEVIRSEVKQQEQQPKQKEVIHQEHNAEQGHIDVTVSLVGNSLGGLYGRYGVAQLAEVLGNPTQISDETNETRYYYLLDGFIRIHLNVFCSTASPMLGCANHTYIPIPRTAEIGVAQVLGETGSDLFRVNDLVQTMATSHRFLKPLASFRKRIAYANAFGTDFPVPTATAAFLDSKSDSPHYFDEDFEENEDDEIAGEIKRKMERQSKEKGCPASERGLIAAILYTPRLQLEENIRAKTKGDVLTAMSSSLDSLGWKKVFIDIRKEIPAAVSLPTMFKSDGTKCPIRQLKSSSHVVRSCDLDRAVSTSSSYRLGLPLGHNAICAFSRGTVSTAVNSGGRPVMDSLAIDLTNNISLWHET